MKIILSLVLLFLVALTGMSATYSRYGIQLELPKGWTIEAIGFNNKGSDFIVNNTDGGRLEILQAKGKVPTAWTKETQDMFTQVFKEDGSELLEGYVCETPAGRVMKLVKKQPGGEIMHSYMLLIQPGIVTYIKYTPKAAGLRAFETMIKRALECKQ